ncbi:hypothetical protein [Enterococcus sp. DIV0212c]
MYHQSAAYRYQVEVQRAKATRMMATVRIKKVCDTARNGREVIQDLL